MRTAVSSWRSWVSQRWSSLVVPTLLLLLSAVQRPGETTFDTKLDLTSDPGRFLARSLELWNPQASFGELQNQAYGYLFPQGPFFLLGDLLAVPDWVTQRLWSGLLLVAAYEGARRLLRAMSPSGGAALAAVAGLAYALSPRLLGLVGVLTGEVLPTAVLPWVVLPLVLAQLGRLTPRTGALLSGCAILGMGGVNAVENLAALPLPALVLVVGIRRPGGRALLRWWVAATTLASLWWMLPLLVLGRYSPEFLDYIETASATTKYLDWMNATRGADHWLGFVRVGDQPWWPAAYALAVSPWLVALTGVVAALGFGGLFHRSMPWRLPLVLSALLGLTGLTLAHGGWLGSPVSGVAEGLLDGPLSALRNVHKVDPLVRLPLALGFANVVRVGVPCLLGRWPRLADLPRWVAPGTAITVLALSAFPMFAGQLRKPGWDRIPSAWSQAAAYLDKNNGGGRVLVLPGSGFAQQVWGSTIDEPLQGLGTAAWVTRSQIPLTPGPTIRFLDSIEERVNDGVGSTRLADVLARAGVSLVVVRRDLDLSMTDAPPPDRVDLAVSRSPGLEQVASFGQAPAGPQAMIDVFRVDRSIETVSMLDEAGLARLSGGPEDVLSALEAGVLAADEAVVVGSYDGPPAVVGDGYRRVERQFGRVHDAVSALMSPSDPLRVPREVFDYPGVAGQPRAYRRHDGVLRMDASSSSGFVDVLGAADPAEGPYSAVDGATTSSWQSASLLRPVGQWIELTLRRAEPVEQLEVLTGNGGGLTVVREVEVRAGDQVVRGTVNPVTGAVTVPLSGEPVRTIRVTVTRTAGDPDEGTVAIREISFPGMFKSGTTVVPVAGAAADASTSFSFRTSPGRRPCLDIGFGVSCDPLRAQPAGGDAGISRQIEVAEAGTWRLTGTAVARSSSVTRRLTEPVGKEVRARSSSVLAGDPLVGPQNALDGNFVSPWLAAIGDRSPTLRLRWGPRRTIERLVLKNALTDSVAPRQAVLEAPGERRVVDLTPGSFGVFKPIRTDRLRITFRIGGLDLEAKSLGVGELKLDGLEGLVYRRSGSTRSGSLCGFGPVVSVDGEEYRTKVRGSLDAVLTGAPLEMVSCDGPVRMALGTHRVSVAPTGQFSPVSVALRGERARPATTSRSAQVTTWGSNSRSVQVGSGGAAVLRVAENVNPGWVASLDGRRLEGVTIDGWQQGYVLPAGEGGVVQLTFSPNRWYRIALATGLVGALVLVVGALLGLIRRRRAVPTRAAGQPVAPAGRTSRMRVWWMAGSVLLAAALGGAGVAAGTLAAVLLPRRPLVLWGAGLVALASLAAAVTSAWGGDAMPWYASLAAAAGVGLLAGTLVADPVGEKAGR